VPANFEDLLRSFKDAESAASRYNLANESLERAMTYPSRPNEESDDISDAFNEDIDQADTDFLNSSESDVEDEDIFNEENPLL